MRVPQIVFSGTVSASMATLYQCPTGHSFIGVAEFRNNDSASHSLVIQKQPSSGSAENIGGCGALLTDQQFIHKMLALGPGDSYLAQADVGAMISCVISGGYQ